MKTELDIESLASMAVIVLYFLWVLLGFYREILDKRRADEQFWERVHMVCGGKGV